MSYPRPGLSQCPYCGCPAECDEVDVGVGYIQCGPYLCVGCGASEMGPEAGPGGVENATEEENRKGWYRAGRVSPHANTFLGELVSHEVAKALYRKNPCPRCNLKDLRAKTPGMSMCPGHLLEARLGWRVWAGERRGLGRCIECDSRGHLDRRTGLRNCRCKGHRERNRVRCATWRETYPEKAKDNDRQQREKKQAYVAAGICPCVLHCVLEPGALRCVLCRFYQNSVVAGRPADVQHIKELWFKVRTRLILAKASAAQAA